MNVLEIEYDELTEELNANKIKNLSVNERAPSESVDLSECSYSVISSVNLNDSCFALEEMLMTTKSIPTLSDSVSSSSSSKYP